MLDTILKILLVIAAFIVNMLIAMLCLVSNFMIPLFLISVVMNIVVGILIGWRF